MFCLVELTGLNCDADGNQWLLAVDKNIHKLIRSLHDPANVEQTSSISTCILNTFARTLLDVSWIV